MNLLILEKNFLKWVELPANQLEKKSNETKELMPLPSLLANKLTYQLTKMRKENKGN